MDTYGLFEGVHRMDPVKAKFDLWPLGSQATPSFQVALV